MSLIKSPKSLLQELTQGKFSITPEYLQVSKTGPDNSPEFVVEVKIGDIISATGKGGSKREAEREAAKMALQKVKEEK